MCAAIIVTGCATAPKPTPPPAAPRAKSTGVTVFIEPAPAPHVASEDCTKGEPALIGSLPQSLERAAQKALADAGFTVVGSKDTAHALTAKIDSTLSYCSNSDAHIATGEAALTLVNDTRVLARGSQSGDLANPPEGLMARVVEQLVYADQVVAFCDAQGH